MKQSLRTRNFASEISWPLATIGNNQRQPIVVYVKRLDFKGSAWFYRWFFLFLCITEHMKRSLFFLEWIIFLMHAAAQLKFKLFQSLYGWRVETDWVMYVASISFVVLNMMVVMARVSVESIQFCPIIYNISFLFLIFNSKIYEPKE